MDPKQVKAKQAKAHASSGWHSVLLGIKVVALRSRPPGVAAWPTETKGETEARPGVGGQPCRSLNHLQAHSSLFLFTAR